MHFSAFKGYLLSFGLVNIVWSECAFSTNMARKSNVTHTSGDYLVCNEKCQVPRSMKFQTLETQQE